MHKIDLKFISGPTCDVDLILRNTFSRELEFPEVLELNVGGVYYTTSLTTLLKGGNDMLSSMFSGRHNVTKDKDGRYFIDADGSLFAHILRYLRTGQMPNDKIAPQVYWEAKYFGLQELMQLIERMPAMMAVHARQQFQDKLDGFEDAIEQILIVANSQQEIFSDEIISYVNISILKENQTYDNPLFNYEHKCWRTTSNGNSKADIYIGPWKNIENMEISVKVYFRALSRELESRGFTVTTSNLGRCAYDCEVSERETLRCPRNIFKLLFHWHKFS